MAKPYTLAGLAVLMATPLAFAQTGLPATYSPATILDAESIDCVAVFELVERELPYQLRQSEMRLARQVWQLRAGRISQDAQTDLGEQVNQRLAVLSPHYEADLNRLAAAADHCRTALHTSSANRF